MKETISFPANAGTLQSSIDWKRVIRTATAFVGRKSLTIIRNANTPWVLTAIAGLSMWLGIALNDDNLYKYSALATVLPFTWGLLRELKNTNIDEL